MHRPTLRGARRLGPVLLVAGVVGGGIVARESIGSDHQQTALTELHPRLDLTDVWVFPGSTDQRIVLAATIASPIAPGANASAGFFDPNALYQIHVDNNMDGREDVVFQFSFDQLRSGGQTFDVVGPARPRTMDNIPGPIGILPGGARHRFATGAPMMMRQAMNMMNTSNLPNNQGQMQVFAGLRDDPFFIDLPRFFGIGPFIDRRPTSGPLSNPGNIPRAGTFRPECNAGGQPVASTLISGATIPANAFEFQQGCAVDFLRGLNALAIVVEVPEAVLTQGSGSGDPQLGVWATISR